MFERLREWRAAQAREQGVPAYVIFQDKTLREIASQRPAGLNALACVNGVGQAKLEKYGPDILEVLTD
jgi:ATP-dependent DNA helicase RecQ